MAMQSITFDDDNGTVEVAFTPKSDGQLYFSLSKKHRHGGGGWFKGPDAMLTKAEAIWMRDQLNQWIESLQEGG